jgi:hypothetical protein
MRVLASPLMSPEDTAASEHGADAETTQVPPPPPGDEPGLAWSVDDDTDEMSTNRHGRLMWAGLAVLVAAITAALVLLVSTRFTRNQANPVHPQPIPSSPVTTTVAAAPAPQTVTVTAPLPAVAAPPPSTETPTTTGHADIRVNPLCWFGTMGAVAPCDDGYGNGNGQLTPAQQLHECKLLAQGPPANRPNWYVSTCVRAD